MQKNILVLGGTQMLGRAFVESIEKSDSFEITLANRGVTNKDLFPRLSHISIDRNDHSSCSKLAGRHYACVVDFSCYNSNQFQNTIQFINCDRYILISTQSVLDQQTLNSNNYNDPYFIYALNKKNLEKYAESHIGSFYLTIIRPCAIVGEHDYTNRFDNRHGIFYWKGTTKLADRTTGCMNISLFTEELLNQLNSFQSSNIEYVNIGP